MPDTASVWRRAARGASSGRPQAGGPQALRVPPWLRASAVGFLRPLRSLLFL